MDKLYSKKHTLKLIVLTIVVIFFVLYSLVSLVPHYNFRTTAWDLGIFNQAIYHYSHFKLGPNTICGSSILLGDHFELILFLFSPLYWIFGSYTLLLIQIFAILFGGIGVFLFLKEKTKDKILSIAGLVLFYLFFGIFNSLAFAYHNNVIGIMFLPWMLYFLKKENIGLYYLFFCLSLICREDIALITGFLGFAILFFEKRSLKKYGLVTLFVSVFYFLLTIKVFIPFFSKESYGYWSYDAIGKSPLEFLGTIILHPIYSISVLFNQETKVQTLKFLLASGGLFVVLQPKYLLLALPIVCRNFMSSHALYYRGDYGFHYLVEFSPIISISAISVISKLKKAIGYRFIKYSLIFILILSNFYLLSQIHFFDGSKLSRIFTSSYYSRDLHNRNELLEAIKLIEPDAKLSAQNTILPHLANRDNIFLFPAINDSDYVILSIRNIWLNNDKDVLAKEYNGYQELDQNMEYEKIYNKEGVVLYQKID